MSDSSYPVEEAEPDTSSSSDEDPLQGLGDLIGLETNEVADSVLSSIFDRNLSLRDTPLEETSLDGIVKYIQDKPNIKIVTMVGAGISTAAGIPDFRSPGTGIYDNLKKYNLPHTSSIFELDYFLANPEPFYRLASEIFPGSYKPTKAHYFIKLLQVKNLLFRHYSQNIDNLDRMCGIKEDKLIEAHGSFHTSHCTNANCKKKFSLEWLREKVSAKVTPMCPKCEHVVKPDITFFGENLPQKFFDNHMMDLLQCELLIIMGSSLTVEPFASLVAMVCKSVPRLMMNATPVGAKYDLKFGIPDNGRDVFLLGDCDRGCQLLIGKLGWTEEFEEILKTSGYYEKVEMEPSTSEA